MKRKFCGSRILGIIGYSAAASLLLASISFPLISLADHGQLRTPEVVYRHMTPEKVVSIYRDAYAKSGMVRFSRRIIYTEAFTDHEKKIREEIRFSKPSSEGGHEYASFYLDAYSKDGICMDCVVTREGYSFHSYEQDWRAIRRIRHGLGQSLAPACNTACPASVEDWINGKSDKTPVPDINQYPPGHQPEAAGHQ